MIDWETVYFKMCYGARNFPKGAQMLNKSVQACMPRELANSLAAYAKNLFRSSVGLVKCSMLARISVLYECVVDKIAYTN